MACRNVACRTQRRGDRTGMMLFGRVSQVWRYPVSSMGGESLQAVNVQEGGILGDRIWGVVDTRSSEVAGPEKRRHWRPLPNLFSRLRPDGPEIGRSDGSWLKADSTEAQKLVSDHLEFPAELRPHVPFETEQEGHVAPRYQRADLHIVTTASMTKLAGLLPDPAQADPRRFRPNLVIETERSFEGFAEHRIVGRKLQIGETVIAVTEPCARCSFTALAQGNLAFEPTVLQSIASHGEGGFGVLCAVERAGEVRLGDEVTLLAT